MRATLLDEHSVAIAISLTGATKDIVDNVKITKLANYADYILLKSVKESPLDSASLVAKITQLFLIDLISTGITMKNYEYKNISNKMC